MRFRPDSHPTLLDLALTVAIAAALLTALAVIAPLAHQILTSPIWGH